MEGTEQWGTLLVVLFTGHSPSLSLPPQLLLPVLLQQLLMLLLLLPKLLLLLYVLYLGLKPIGPAHPLSSQSGQIQET